MNYIRTDVVFLNNVYEDAIKSCTKEVAGKVAGTDFYARLNEIGALGTDARGAARTGDWWPGAYQQN